MLSRQPQTDGPGPFAAWLEAVLPPSPGRAFAFWSIVVLFAWTVFLGWLSQGALQADDITHHLMARFAWRDPRFLLDCWGRPGFTLLHFPLARFGMFGSRVTSALLSAGSAWLAYLLARRLGVRRPYLAPLLLYAQPLFTMLAFTSLTETALAFYFVLALWLWSRDRLMLSAAVISLGMVTRHEACLWVGVWGIALLVRLVLSARRGPAPSPTTSGEVPVPVPPADQPGSPPLPPGERAGVRGRLPLSNRQRDPHPDPLPEREREPAPGPAGPGETPIRVAHAGPTTSSPWRVAVALGLLIWAPLVHNILYFRVAHEWPFVEKFLNPSGKVDYGSGTLAHFAGRWPATSGYGIVPLAVIGLVLLCGRRRGWLLVACTAVYFAAETALYASGSYESAGYVRFLAPLCPALAVAAGLAVDRMLDGRRIAFIVGPSAVVTGLALAWCAEYELNLPDAYFESDYLYATLKDTPRLGHAVAAGGALCMILSLVRRAAGRRLLQLGALALIVISLFQTYHAVGPYRLRPLEEGLWEAAEVIRRDHPDRLVLSMNVWYAHFDGRTRSWGYPVLDRPTLERAPVGTLAVWDSHFGVRYDDGQSGDAVPLEWLDRQPWMKAVWTWYWPGTLQTHVCVFEKVAQPPGGEAQP